MLFEKRAQKADDEYRSQIQEIVRTLLREYKSVIFAEMGEFADEFALVDSKTSHEEQARRKKFLYHLNKSGVYFSFKEKLKSAVVNVVRERFQKKSPFSATPELQLFLSEVYVYLMDQMHIAINKMFSEPESAFIDPTISKTADFSLLKKFADESEFDCQIHNASIYHQERIAKFEDSMQAWFDYGSFCMRSFMPEKGLECFREILSRNPKHIPSLLAYGSLCACQDKLEEARVHLATAVDLQPKYVLALTILSLLYEAIGEELESEKLMEEANTLHKNTHGSDSPSVLLLASEFLIQVHAGQIAERALSQELLNAGPSIRPYLLLSQLELQRGNQILAIDHIQAAINVQQDDPDVWACLGHLQFAIKEWDNARVSYETVMSLSKDPTNVAQIYVRLGTLYMMNTGDLSGSVATRSIQEIENAKKAKSMFLRACENHPTSKSWLGVGKACITLGNLDEAEDALSEANVLNNRDSEVWAYLALLCLMQDRQFEANQCISQALRQGIKDINIL
ncbi:Cilia- and flagella-associated protein 70, partial [Blyttiomyces sp. JEL0837]